MSYQRSAITAYQSAVMTTPPLQAVVLLYDGILVRLYNAGKAADQGDFGRQYDETASAIRILRGLLAALDLHRGGDIGRGLSETYRVNMQALLASVGQPDASARLSTIAGGLRILRNAWAEIAGMAARDGQEPGNA